MPENVEQSLNKVDEKSAASEAVVGNAETASTETAAPESSAREKWLRLLFMLLFTLIYSVAEIVVFVIAVLQFGFVLFTDAPNQRLLELGRSVSKYVYAIIRFFTYGTEDMPFPFADWPQPGDD